MKRMRISGSWKRVCLTAAVVGALGGMVGGVRAEEEKVAASPPGQPGALAGPQMGEAVMASASISASGGNAAGSDGAVKSMQTAPVVTGPGIAGPGIAGRRGPRSVSAPTNLPPATFKLPGEYGILDKRSIFARDGMAAGAKGVVGGGAEATLALRGIVSDEQSFLVFIEDLGAHRMMQLRPGDAVGGGRVGKICMDDFSFETKGGVKRIGVGQNLMGMVVPPVAPPPQAGPPGADQSKPGEGGPPKVAPPPGAVMEGPRGRPKNVELRMAG